MSTLIENVENIEILLKKSRRIVSDIEEIVEQHYGWIELVDGRLIAYVAYDSLIEYFGSKGKAGNQTDNKKKIIWGLWPITKIIYHIMVSKIHGLFKAINTNSISDAILMLPGVGSLSNFLSRLEDNLKESYSCVSMTTSARNTPRKIKRLLVTNSLPYIEGFLSFSDVFLFVRTMMQVAKSRFNFVQDIQKRIFIKYNINNHAIKREIINNLFYSLFDNIEYGLIGQRIVQCNPRALISDIASYGKIAYIMSYANKKGIITIGIQHGVMIDPFKYFPASKYFGYSSKYALKKLEDLENPRKRETHYFLCGLPEQMTAKAIVPDHGIQAVGLVDSNESIRMDKRQSVEILQKSENIHKLPVLYVKSHPRAGNAMKVENWYALSNYKSMGVSSWDNFCGRINIAITFSFDAVYELLIRKIVTIVINPSKRFNTGYYADLNNLKFACNSAELDSILLDILDKKLIWDKSTEQEITDYLSYVFGRSDDRLYGNAVKGILAKCICS